MGAWDSRILTGLLDDRTAHIMGGVDSRSHGGSGWVDGWALRDNNTGCGFDSTSNIPDSLSAFFFVNER